MIHSKVPLFAAALGAVATFGFVWLGRRSRPRGLAAPRELPPLEPDDVARADALRDLDIVDLDADELDIVWDADDAEVVEDSGERVALGQLDEEALANDEPYDAVDPESIGTEFLRRATEADAPRGEPAPLPAFVEAVDVAVELPVGRLESDGSTELHAPEGQLGPATDLSPNDDELEQRRAEQAERDGSHKPNE